jgi:hypothetical protein
VGHCINQVACWLLIRFASAIWSFKQGASNFPVSHGHTGSALIQWCPGGPWDVFECFDLLCNSCIQKRYQYIIEKSWELQHFTIFYAYSAYNCQRLGARFFGLSVARNGSDGVGPAPEKLDAAESHHSETRWCPKGATIPILQPNFIHVLFWVFVLAFLSKYVIYMTWEWVDSGRVFILSVGTIRYQWLWLFFCAQRFAAARHHQVIHGHSNVGEARASHWKPSLFWGLQSLDGIWHIPGEIIDGWICFLFMFEAGHVTEKMRPDETMKNCWFCGKPLAVWTMDLTLIVGGWGTGGTILGPKHVHTPRAPDEHPSIPELLWPSGFSTSCVWWMSRTLERNAHWDTFRVGMDTADGSFLP